MNSKIVVPTIVVAPAAITAPSVLLSQSNLKPTEFRKVEVHFYDKETTTKKIRLYVDNLEGTNSFEFYDTSESKENNKWKNVQQVTEDDKSLYQKLFAIASKYIRTQDSLNLIKSNIKNDKEDTFLNNNKCCSKAKGTVTCDCTKENNCCSMCLACYSDNGKTNNCCDNSSECTWTEFKKIQKTFGYLRKNLYSANHNIYLSPMQAHIKFTDNISFDDIKTSSSSAEKEKQQKEFKGFVGSLVYGFVNYSYNQVSYDEKILNNSSEYTNLTDKSKDIYFYNIPQKFSFLYKEGSEKEENLDIEVINKEVKDVSKTIKTYKTLNQNSSDCCNQQETKDGIMKCLLGRNYMFLEKESNGLSNIATKIKSTKEGCCAGSSGPSF